MKNQAATGVGSSAVVRPMIFMNNESLNDKAVSALAMMKEVERALEGVNDYGEATGFRDDHDQLVNDFHSVLGMMRSRASRLIQRANRHKKRSIPISA
jgi:hypothetical protein